MTADTRSESVPSTSAVQDNQLIGIVIAHFGTRLLVETTDRHQHECHARKSAGALVTGDRVVIETDDRSPVIVHRLPRDSELVRPDSRGKPRIIAANIEQMLIVITTRPEFKRGLIDRYLVAAELSRIIPVIVLNKIDLLDEPELIELQQSLAVYDQIGYQVIAISTQQNRGTESLQEILNGHSNIVVGQSGVGKSSLINCLLPEVDARIGDVSQATNKGTHTTTTARLYPLAGHHGSIIDSPGVREFGLWQVSPGDLADGFREFREYRDACRFRDCLHRKEPGCAVRDAADRGEIDQRRYHSYLALLESVEQEKN
jgi:ribosome biogenesis GTPase